MNDPIFLHHLTDVDAVTGRGAGDRSPVEPNPPGADVNLFADDANLFALHAIPAPHEPDDGERRRDVARERLRRVVACAVDRLNVAASRLRQQVSEWSEARAERPRRATMRVPRRGRRIAALGALGALGLASVATLASLSGLGDDRRRDRSRMTRAPSSQERASLPKPEASPTAATSRARVDRTAQPEPSSDRTTERARRRTADAARRRAGAARARARRRTRSAPSRQAQPVATVTAPQAAPTAASAPAATAPAAAPAPVHNTDEFGFEQ